MAENNSTQTREPDKLDVVLAAGYSFHVYGVQAGLFAVRLQLPTGQPFNEVYGASGLDAIDKSVAIAAAHLTQQGGER